MREAEIRAACESLSQALQSFIEAVTAQPEKPHYTIPEAVELLGVTRRTVMEHIRAGDFGDIIEIDARHILIPASGMEAYLEAKTKRRSGRRAHGRQRRGRAPSQFPGPI